MKTQWLKSVLSSRYLRLFVGLGFSVLSLYLAIRNVDFAQVWALISKTKLWLLVMALLVVITSNLAKTLRWRVLLGEKGKNIHLAQIFVSHLAGQTLNVVFPARLGDLSRAYFIGSMGPGRVFVLGTIVLEKLPDLLTYASLTVCLLLLIPLPGWVGQSDYAVVIIIVLASLAVLVLIFQREWLLGLLDRLTAWLPERLQNSYRKYLVAGLSSLDVLQSRRSVFYLIFWTTLIWVSAVVVNHLVLLALGLVLPWLTSLSVLVALQAAILLPSVPGRIGVFEYICIQTLKFFEVGQTEALSYGILLHAVIFLPVVLLGLPFLGFLELGDGQQLGASKGGQR